MRVGQRLFLAVIPAVLGVCTVAALAYWGQYAHAAPEALVIIAVLASVASLVVAWRNTRYVAQRIERLAGSSGALRAAPVSNGASMEHDEIDEIERSVRGLSTAVHDARTDATNRERAAEERVRTYARLLEELLRIIPARLEESQLPLHILLESPFGELNENQEELLGAARNAIEAADVEVRRLQKLLDLERGAVSFVKQPMGVAELLRAPLAIAAARAEKAGVSYRWSVPMELPRVLVDPTHMQEALTSALGLAIERTSAGATLVVEATEAHDGERITISIAHGDGANVFSGEGLLARRMIEMQGGTIADGARATIIDLPAERLGKPDAAAPRTTVQHE
jgi:hypothetical protein